MGPQNFDRHISRRPIDNGVALIHGHTHSRVAGASGNQFHVGVDAFGFEPVPFSVIDAWLDALRPGGAVPADSHDAVARRAPTPDYVERSVRLAELSA